MQAIIIYQDNKETKGGIYEIGLKFAMDFLKDNLMYYIPLKVSGDTYDDKKDHLGQLAHSWQNSHYDFIDWSYKELSIIQGFFEENAKRYGLTREFHENGII